MEGSSLRNWFLLKRNFDNTSKSSAECRPSLYDAVDVAVELREVDRGREEGEEADGDGVQGEPVNYGSLIIITAGHSNYYSLLLHRDTVSHSYQIGDCFLESSFGLVVRATDAIHPRQIHSGSNFQKSSHQTDMNDYVTVYVVTIN